MYIAISGQLITVQEITLKANYYDLCDEGCVTG